MSAKLRGNICKPEECETIKMSAEAIDKRDKKIQVLSDALDLAGKALSDTTQLLDCCKCKMFGKKLSVDKGYKALQKIAEAREGE